MTDAPAEGGPALTEPPAPEAAPPAEAPEASSPEVAARATPPEETAEHRRAAAEQDRLARENAQRIEQEIEALRLGHGDGVHRQFRAFFEHERNLHAMFKEVRPLHPHDRHRLWKRLKQVGIEARQAQQEEWESRRYQSIEARETVEEKLRSAEALTQEAQGPSDYRKAETLLNEVRALLSGDAPGAPGQLLIGPDRRACWDHWRTARDVLRKKHGGQQEQSLQALTALVTEVSTAAATGDAFRAVQRIKELQAQLGKADLRRSQFEDLRKRLSAAWQQAQARMAEQRQERAQQRTAWRERMEGHLARWRDTLGQKHGQREHLLQQNAKLAEMEQNARSPEFAEQVRGWQAGTAEKLRRAEESIAELEERIRGAEKRLGGRRAPTEGEPAPREANADPAPES